MNRISNETVRQLVLVVGLSLLVISAGCGKPAPTWELGVEVESIEGDSPPYSFQIAVEIGGQPLDVAVHTITVRFVADDGSLITTRTVEEMGPTSNYVSENVNATLPTLPRKIILQANRVDNPEDQEYSFQGLRLQSTDPIRYAPFYMNKSAIVGSS